MRIFVNLKLDDVVFLDGDRQYIFFPDDAIELKEDDFDNWDYFSTYLWEFDRITGAQEVESFDKLQEILHEHLNKPLL